MQHALAARLNLDHGLIQAPMAGGPTTPALVAAVSNAGGLGCIGAGYLSPTSLEAAIGAVRSATGRAFGVNLFVPGAYTPNPGRVARANRRMADFRSELGIDTPSEVGPVAPDFEGQFEVLVDAAPAVVSTTFGALAPERVSRLQYAGCFVIGTATTVAEARYLETTGVDAVVAQGFEAGGHRGSFLDNFERSAVGTLALVPQIVDAIARPVIASGGIMDGRGIAAAHCLGAAAVQMGTAFLATEESGAKPEHKAALPGAADTATTLTAAFSGKPARGLRNRFIETFEHSDDALPDYPEQNAWTKDIRAAAARQSRPEFLSMWAGQAAGLARAMPASELVAALVAEARALIPDCI
ncbi:NAD(P)H-dependent flavin oxidoreductase [Salinisphaera hydrothermalis]|uniref:NAD(P)H-dependent flavin oxidoreductase n=1 Tax=Salinisphaera hydrothermalis TaxID=563188 RepID=UPI0033412162